MRYTRSGLLGVLLAAAFALAFDACEKSATAPRSDLVFAQVSAGRGTCALTAAGAAYCWANSLANGAMGTQGTPVPVTGGLSFHTLSVGELHTCGVTAAGVAYCWGDNQDGQLGIGSSDVSPHAAPEAVTGGLSFATMSAGSRHTCGLTSSGVAYCWGDNSFGELGSASFISSSTPVVVAGGLTFTAVSAGGFHTCGLTTAGAAYCWGANSSGQLGDGTTTGRTSPVPVAGGLTFAAVSPGFDHTCGVTTGGAAYCWGSNLYRGLGNGSLAGDMTPHPAPGAVAGGQTFQTVSAGNTQTCALTAGGAAYCWGFNWYDLLGDGKTTDSSTPAAVAGGFSFAAVSAGEDHTCGLTRAGAVHCWGGYLS